LGAQYHSFTVGSRPCSGHTCQKHPSTKTATRRGYRFRKDYRLDLNGGARVRPDIAFTARRVAVFVDGCFWHVCPEHGRDPTVNEWYWAPKLRRNVERDRTADAALAEAGWQVVRVWEHVPLTDAVAAVVAALAGPADAGQ